MDLKQAEIKRKKQSQHAANFFPLLAIGGLNVPSFLWSWCFALVLLSPLWAFMIWGMLREVAKTIISFPKYVASHSFLFGMCIILI